MSDSKLMILSSMERKERWGEVKSGYDFLQSIQKSLQNCVITTDTYTHIRFEQKKIVDVQYM